MKHSRMYDRTVSPLTILALIKSTQTICRLFAKPQMALTSILIFIFLRLLVLMAATVECEVNLSKHPIILIISYDGFRHDYLKLASTPNLNNFRRRGVTVPYLKNEFLTTTLPNHHSIATGLHVESHGVVSNYLYDPLYDRFLNWTKDAEFWNYSNVLPLWTLNELAGDGRVSGVMMWPGANQPYGPTNHRVTYVKETNGTYPYLQRAEDVISWITDPVRPANLIFMLFEEPDLSGHTYGPSGDGTLKSIELMDDITGHLVHKLDSLNITDKVNLIFLSDHGMSDVPVGHVIDFESIMNGSKYKNYGGRSLLQLLPTNENETMEIYYTFKVASKRMHFTVYLKEELNPTKSHWHYSNCRRVMPILVLADQGYIFKLPKKTNFEFHGMHGYDNAHLNMRPFFVAAGPLFKQNFTGKPFKNVDIFPLVCHALNIPPPPNNGSLAHVLPLLKET